MGTLTFVELQDEVRYGLGNRTDLDTRLGRFLNLAQQRLARMHDFDEMETRSVVTIDNTGAATDGDIVLPSLRELYSIVIHDGSRSRKLDARSTRWFDRMVPKPDYHTRDIPSIYMTWSNTAYLFPLPEKAYTNAVFLRWTKWPTDLTGTATSEFLQKDELLIELALVYAYRSLGNPEEALKHNRFALALMSESEDTDRTKPDLGQVGDAKQVGGQSAVGDYWLDPFQKEMP